MPPRGIDTMAEAHGPDLGELADAQVKADELSGRKDERDGQAA